MTPTCDSPAVNCPKKARSVILARSTENAVGNGMAVWTTYFLCEQGHSAADLVKHMERADPGVQLMVFECMNDLELDTYLAVLGA